MCVLRLEGFGFGLVTTREVVPWPGSCGSSPNIHLLIRDSLLISTDNLLCLLLHALTAADDSHRRPYPAERNVILFAAMEASERMRILHREATLGKIWIYMASLEKYSCPLRLSIGNFAGSPTLVDILHRRGRSTAGCVSFCLVALLLSRELPAWNGSLITTTQKSAIWCV